MTENRISFKKILCLILAALTLAVNYGLPVLSEDVLPETVLPESESSENASSENASTEDICFNSDETVCQTKIPPVPYVWEAELTVAKDAPNQRLGTIIGNYFDNYAPSVNFEIRELGQLGIWYSDGSGHDARVIFKSFDSRTGEKINVKVEVDPAFGTAALSANGTVVETAKINVPDFELIEPLCVGGDRRRGNYLFLSSYVKIHTLKATGRDGDIFCYDLSEGLSDKTGNGYDLSVTKTERWVSFSSSKTYKLDRPLRAVPKYVEASVRLPEKARGGYSGVIFGNGGANGDSLNFEIANGGIPRITCISSGKKYEVLFDGVCAADGKKKTVAFSIGDKTDAGMATFSLIIDGKIVSTVSAEAFPENMYFSENFCIGGDNANGNANYFRGVLTGVCISFDSMGKDCIASFETHDDSSIITDKKGNFSVCFSENFWEKHTPNDGKEYAFSMAVVGDVQTITGFYPGRLHEISDWLLAEKSQKNIEYVFFTGDITEHDTEEQWKLATDEIKRLDGQIPYSTVRGNHDSKKRYQAYTGNELNYYREFSVGKNKFLLVCLDYGASDEHLREAGAIIAAHPDSRVIVLTHSYLCHDGTTLDANDDSPPSKTGGTNNGDDVWEKLIKLYPNVELVICGHDPSDNVVVSADIGLYGNVVTQLLVDPQNADFGSPCGMVCMLYFDEDGTDCFYDYYSCTKELYYKPSEDSRFDLGTGAIHKHVGLDADGDGRFTTLDAAFAVRKEPETIDQTFKAKYEFNGDGELNEEDAVCLLKNMLAPNDYGLRIKPIETA